MEIIVISSSSSIEDSISEDLLANAQDNPFLILEPKYPELHKIKEKEVERILTKELDTDEYGNGNGYCIENDCLMNFICRFHFDEECDRIWTFWYLLNCITNVVLPFDMIWLILGFVLLSIREKTRNQHGRYRIHDYIGHCIGTTQKPCHKIIHYTKEECKYLSKSTGQQCSALGCHNYGCYECISQTWVDNICSKCGTIEYDEYDIYKYVSSPRQSKYPSLSSASSLASLSDESVEPDETNEPALNVDNYIGNPILFEYLFINRLKSSCLFNFLILSWYSKLTFFNYVIPNELVSYIIRIYFNLQSQYIAQNITSCNICPCKEEKCIITWYKDEENKDVTQDWDVRHCATDYCHKILRLEYDGFECITCNQPYCNDCHGDDDECRHCVSSSSVSQSYSDYSTN
jgi:hypothetical protein